MESSNAETNGELSFFFDLGGESLVNDVLSYESLFTATQADAVVYPTKGWVHPGAVKSVQGYSGGMRLICEFAVVDLLWVAADCLRVWIRHDQAFQDDFSYAVSQEPVPPVRYDLIDTTDLVEMLTLELRCIIHKAIFKIELRSHDGMILSEDAGGAMLHPSGVIQISLALAADESSYGLGERAHRLNLRGQRYAFWNTDQPKCDEGVDPLYYCVPLYVGVHTHGAYGVFVDNSYRGQVDVGLIDPNALLWQFEAGELRYYLMGGKDTQQITSRYTTITGRAQLPPLWFFGYQQSRFSYFPQAKVIEIAETLRAKHIPCDVIYLDIHYMDQFKVFTWDETRFPDFKGMIQDLHRRGFKVVVIVDPGVKIANYPAYHEGLAQEVFVKLGGGLLKVVIWAGASYMPDFTTEKVRQWWASQLQGLLGAGVDGLWNDMNEPAVFATRAAVSLPDAASHDKEGRGGNHHELHNVYGMLMSRASQAGLQQAYPDRRPVNITRAGYAGTQRYATTWTGDVSSNWEHLRLSIPMVLNLGLSGVPFTGPDVGGFRGDTEPELFVRWFQAACLMPFFRNHSAIDTVEQEVWSFGDPYERMVRETIELRYRLMPYLYSVAAQAHMYGWSLVRPLFTADPTSKALRDVDDCYLLGDSLLVAPILHKGQTSRKVMLPRGGWYNYWTNRYYEGNETIEVGVPLERLPLFVRAGAVIPSWDVMQNLSRVNASALNLKVYPGNHETVLYDDAYEGLGYLQGESRWTYITTGWAGNRLRIQRRITGQFEPVYKQFKIAVVGFDEEPLAVRVDRQGAPVWYYEDKMVDMTLKDFQTIEIARRTAHDDETVIHRPW
ncbi:MAG: TIM-barrel domain-containing protein [Phototrophicaceae bacterium]